MLVNHDAGTRDVVEDRLATFTDHNDWDGYLFPSPHTSGGSISQWTIWNRFSQLANRAGLPDEIGGVIPAPKMGRRYWYDAYSASLDVVLGSLDEIAAEQGSASADVVLQTISRIRGPGRSAGSICASSWLLHSNQAKSDTWTPPTSVATQALLLSTRIMYCMSKATGDPERAINGLMSVAQLLEEPRLARLYTYILREGEVTIDEIVADIDTPRTTAYADTGTLVDLGVLTRDETQKTHTYTAIPITLTANLDGDTYTITPTLVEAIGRSPQDQDLDLLIEKHGMGKLAAALTYAIPYVEGGMTERLAARELNLQPAFGIAVLQALREVILDMREYDPYFDQIRNARDKPVDEEA